MSPAPPRRGPRCAPILVASLAALARGARIVSPSWGEPLVAVPASLKALAALHVDARRSDEERREPLEAPRHEGASQREAAEPSQDVARPLTAQGAPEQRATLQASPLGCVMWPALGENLPESPKSYSSVGRLL